MASNTTLNVDVSQGYVIGVDIGSNVDIDIPIASLNIDNIVQSQLINYISTIQISVLFINEILEVEVVILGKSLSGNAEFYKILNINLKNLNNQDLSYLKLDGTDVQPNV
jgi:hypothetical protein